MKKITSVLLFSMFGIVAFAQENTSPQTDTARVSKTHKNEWKHSKAGKKYDKDVIMKAADLSPEQQEKMKKMRMENKSKMIAIRNDASLTDSQKQAKLKEMKNSEANNIKNILTPEQVEKMNKAREEIKEKRKQKKTEVNSPA